jgi:hypothetical protein
MATAAPIPVDVALFAGLRHQFTFPVIVKRNPRRTRGQMRALAVILDLRFEDV